MKNTLVLLFFLLSSINATISFASSVGGIPKNPLQENAPTWFVYKLSAGESYQDSFMLYNNSNENKLIKVFALDAKENLSTSQFSISSDDTPNTEMGKWITFPEEYIEIAPNSSKEVFFETKVPTNYNSEYRKSAAVILMDDVSHKIIDSYFPSGIQISTRSGIRVYNILPK